MKKILARLIVDFVLCTLLTLLLYRFFPIDIEMLGIWKTFFMVLFVKVAFIFIKD